MGSLGAHFFYGKVALWPKLSFPREIMMMIVTDAEAGDF